LAACRARRRTRSHRQLERLGVEVITSLSVGHVDAHQVRLTNGRIVDAHFVAWAAGGAASPLGKLLGCELDRGGRVRVQPDLSVPGHPDIFVIGDMAACLQPNGLHLVPGVAPAAKQTGHYVGALIGARVELGTPPGPFVYRDYGALATIWRNAAVVNLGRLKLRGRPAWLFWLFVHIMFLRCAQLRLAAERHGYGACRPARARRATSSPLLRPRNPDLASQNRSYLTLARKVFQDREQLMIQANRNKLWHQCRLFAAMRNDPGKCL
jgi:NADH dehydrogenase FAD-containing subunit